MSERPDARSGTRGRTRGRAPVRGGDLWDGGLAAGGASATLSGPWRAELLYADAPYGVGYVVATWTR